MGQYDIYNHVLGPWTLFRATRTILGLVVPFWPLLVTLGHLRPFGCCFGPFQGPRGSLRGAPKRFPLTNLGFCPNRLDFCILGYSKHFIFSWKFSFFLVGIGWDWGILGSNNLMNWWDINPPFMYCVFHHISDHLQRLILFWRAFHRSRHRRAILLSRLLTLATQSSRIQKSLVKNSWKPPFQLLASTLRPPTMQTF